MLVDEFGVAGGWLRWSVASRPRLSDTVAGGRGFEIAANLARALSDAAIEVTHGVAWGLFEERLVGVVADNASMQVRATSVVVATGSTDIVTPLPGWDLPGVLTARAALRCLHEWRVLPGERVLVLGAGAEADELREAFRLSDVEPEQTDHASAVGGDGRVAWAEVAGGRVDVDCVVIAEGRQPDPELAMQTLCEIGFSELDGAWAPLRSDTLETSVSGVYVVGDAAGSCSAPEAFAEGRLAGLAAVGADVSEATAALAELRDAPRAAELMRLRLPALTGA
jgi:sarcosine oxidase subunit alpha